MRGGARTGRQRFCVDAVELEVSVVRDEDDPTVVALLAEGLGRARRPRSWASGLIRRRQRQRPRAGLPRRNGRLAGWPGRPGPGSGAPPSGRRRRGRPQDRGFLPRVYEVAAPAFALVALPATRARPSPLRTPPPRRRPATRPDPSGSPGDRWRPVRRRGPPPLRWHPRHGARPEH